MPFGSEYWAMPQARNRQQMQIPTVQGGQQPQQGQIPRVEDYWTPQESEMAAEDEMKKNIAARGPVAQIGEGDNPTIINLGAALGIVSDVIEAKKRREMGMPVQARYDEAKWRYVQDRTERDMQERSEDRRVDNERLAAHNAALEEQSKRSADAMEAWRLVQSNNINTDNARQAARDAEMRAERERAFGFRERELGLSGSRLTQDQKQFEENQKRLRENQDERPERYDEAGNAVYQAKLKEFTAPESVGGAFLSENEKDALRPLEAARHRKPAPAAAPKAAAPAAAPAGGAKAGFKTPQDVKAAVAAGKLSRDEAHKVLTTQFGFTD